MKLIRESDYVDPARLSDEKSMWQMYLLSYSFPTSKINVGVFVACFVSLVVFGFLVGDNNSILISMTRAILSFGVSLAPSILGFLVAGFTIFVTVTRADLFEYMAIVRYGKSRHSYLKYNMSAFMLAFCHYIAYLIFCAVLTVFAQPGGPVGILMKALDEFLRANYGIRFYGFAVILLMSFLGAWTVYLLMLLKSFIYNTYQVLTTTVRWGLGEDKGRRFVEYGSTKGIER